MDFVELQMGITITVFIDHSFFVAATSQEY